MDQDRLAAACARHLGQPVRLEGLRRLSGGASRETWSFEAVSGDARLGLVLRRDPPGAANTADRATEFALLRAAAAGGVPAPAPRFLLDDDDGLGPGFAMDLVAGETIARRILRDDAYAAARPVMARQCGEILARMHRIDPATLPSLPAPRPGEPPARAEVDRYRALLDDLGEPHPAFELALRWLEEHLAESGRLALVHGDFRNGNFVVGPEGIRAVLDWELAHLGDPMEDLGWLCVKSWRYGVNGNPVGGFGRREELFAAYESAGGGRVDPEVVRFWEIFGNVKWGVLCVLQASLHLRHLQRSVELAALGRRACEMEDELLKLIDERARAAARAPRPAGGPR